MKGADLESPEAIRLRGLGQEGFGTIDLFTRPEGLDKRGTDPFWVFLLLFAFLTFSLRRIQFQEKPTITLCSTWISFAFWVTWISRSAKITSDLTLRSTQVPKISLLYNLQFCIVSWEIICTRAGSPCQLVTSGSLCKKFLSPLCVAVFSYRMRQKWQKLINYTT